MLQTHTRDALCSRVRAIQKRRTNFPGETGAAFVVLFAHSLLLGAGEYECEAQNTSERAGQDVASRLPVVVHQETVSDIGESQQNEHGNSRSKELGHHFLRRAVST